MGDRGVGELVDYNSRVHRSTANPTEQAIQSRLDFLIPLPIALLMIVADAFISSDFAATGAWGAFASLWVFNALLVWNILARRRLKKKLGRLLTVRCPTCDYDLRASKGRCPECGTPIELNLVPQHKSDFSN